MIQSRRLVAGDVEAVLAIAAASPGAAAWTRQFYEEVVIHSSGSCCLVAEKDGCLAGFVCFRAVMEETELLNLAVHPSYRRQGIGSFLVKQVLLEAAGKGAEHIFLEVSDKNDAALELYARLGFERVGRRPGYYTSPPADAVLMQRRLREANL
ncbi:MAG: ribosomal protein S18-alanine N-acetyltransferase [Acidobacteria bacterium]|nr:ribosomal protein S18-alanine N-acetyltransferase [Acidobacteriota bacterium]